MGCLAGLSEMAEGASFSLGCLQDLSVQEFVDRFEAPRLPVVITGLTDSWKAKTEWTEDRLLQRFADHKFKVQSLCFLLMGTGVKL